MAFETDIVTCKMANTVAFKHYSALLVCFVLFFIFYKWDWEDVLADELLGVFKSPEANANNEAQQCTPVIPVLRK